MTDDYDRLLDTEAFERESDVRRRRAYSFGRAASIESRDASGRQVRGWAVSAGHARPHACHRRFGRSLGTLVVISILTSAAAAQTPRTSSQTQTSWAEPFVLQPVVVDTSQGRVRGLLKSASDDKLVVDVRNPELWVSPRFISRELAMSDVKRVSVRKKDTIVDGVVIGAAAMLACLKWIGCNQGFDGQHNARDWSVGVALGAVFGGGFDSSVHGTKEIFRKGTTASGTRPPGGTAIRISMKF